MRCRAAWDKESDSMGLIVGDVRVDRKTCGAVVEKGKLREV